ncbi:unnamed protein product [Cyclocybe aegerita]|uniref:Uncharacterized protein n=1 Tax=Cyclocybe aegerita TaxID=1973307 RepID=A0A8S0WMT4_CYCAE|nr:unnamed protein product [Cyclocybe aegerita]
MTNIKELATEQYQHELNRERDQRRRAATLPSSSDASANANLSGHEQVSSSASSRKPCVADFEPDKEWKAQLKKRIEDALEPMVQYVEERQQAELGKGPFNAEARMRLETEYKQTMNSIKELANGQYLLELNRERDQRRQTAATVSRPPA